MTERLLSRQEIIAGFDCLHDLLAERNRFARIYIVGGATMSLLYLRPPPGLTQDVDAVLMETNAPLQQLIWEVASRLRYPLEWLNQGPRGLGLPIHDEIQDRQVFYETPHLVVAGASLEYMLALKTDAARKQDHFDFYVLCDKLQIRDMEQVLAVHRKVFPKDEWHLDGEKLHRVQQWVSDFDKGPPDPPHAEKKGQPDDLPE